MKLAVLGVIPIPRGHRVSVRWYEKAGKGLFGGATRETHPTRPVVEDLDAGIVYAFDWIFDCAPLPSSGDESSEQVSPLVFGDAPSAGVKEQRSLVGRVTACRIVTMDASAQGSLKGATVGQTELTIEEER